MTHVNLTLHISSKQLLVGLCNLLQSEVSDDVEDLLDICSTSLIGILAFCGRIGTLEHEVFTTDVDFLEINLPKTVTNILDLVGVGDDLIGCRRRDIL